MASPAEPTQPLPTPPLPTPPRPPHPVPQQPLPLHPVPQQPATPDRPPAPSPLLGIALGALAGIVGLLPWLVGGGRLLLQNLWATDTLPGDMPLTLLPVSQYAATTILAVLVIGGVLAGSLARWQHTRSGAARWPVIVGLATIQLIAVVQSFAVVGRGHGIFDGTAHPRASLYVGGMLGGTLVCVGFGVLGAVLVSRTSRAVAALGFALAAAPAGSWVSAFINTLDGPGTLTATSGAVRWLPAVVVGLALGWCGFRPARNLVVWALGLAQLCLVPPLLTAMTYALGMRVLDGDLREMASAAAQIFPAALGEAWAPVAVAAAIAVVFAGARKVLRRRQP